MHDIRTLITKTWNAKIYRDEMHNKGTHYNIDMIFVTDRYKYCLTSDKGQFVLTKYNRDTKEHCGTHECRSAIKMYGFMKYIINY